MLCHIKLLEIQTSSEEDSQSSESMEISFGSDMSKDIIIPSIEESTEDESSQSSETVENDSVPDISEDVIIPLSTTVLSLIMEPIICKGMH